MSGYTLSEAEVRLAYIESHENAFPTSRTMHSQEFDRWLAAHDARVARESAERAWDEGVAHLKGVYGVRCRPKHNPYRADRIASERTTP